MDSSMSTGKIAIIAAAAFSALIIVAGVVSLSAANKDRVIIGVQAMGSSISGMKKSDAEHFFEKAGADRISKMPIVLEYDNKTWTIAPEDIHLTANTGEAVENAYSIGRGGSFLQNLLNQMKYAVTGCNVELTADYDRQLLAAKLQEVAKAIDAQPVNASMDFQADGSLRRIPGAIGKKLDPAPIAEALEPQLVSLKHIKTIALEPEEIQPYVTDADLANIDCILGAYTTDFSYGNRGDNIILASEHLNDILIRSGTVFSFNNTVGERTASAGYKSAPVIVDGMTEPGIGGGVCQVSTTLYNAVLLSGLTPTVRTPHYFRSSYCPPGLDATVADGLLDFQFKNQLPHNVYLLARTYGSSLTIYVLGTKNDLNGNTISMEQEGSALRPTIYRIYSRNGQVIEREYMHTDSYAS